MAVAPGVAGSTEPELEGVFLATNQFEVDFFLEMNNTGGPVDLWEVAGIESSELVESSEGFSYYPARISADQIKLVRPGRVVSPQAPGTIRRSRAAPPSSAASAAWYSTES